MCWRWWTGAGDSPAGRNRALAAAGEDCFTSACFREEQDPQQFRVHCGEGFVAIGSGRFGALEEIQAYVDGMTSTNGDGGADITDATYLLNYLFLGGLTPESPFPDCGPGTLPQDPETCQTPPGMCPQ
jgi:hypothetical protein